MRIRTVITTAALAAALVGGLATVASAAEPATGSTSASTAEATQKGFNDADISHADLEIFECFEKQMPKASPDFVGCSEAPSPILPATNELLWGTLAFAVLLAFMVWKGYPAMKKGMDGRSERIRSDLARADEAKAEAENVLITYQAQVAAAKGEATRIIEDARATAEATKAELRKRADTEIVEMRQRAQADIEAAKVQAISDLKSEVATLAIGAAEMVVQKSLDQATQLQLIENYINQVGSAN